MSTARRFELAVLDNTSGQEQTTAWGYGGAG